MTGRRLLRIAVWALALGLVIALPVGGQQRVSVELWLVALTVWLLIGLAATLVRAAPPHGGRRPWLFPAFTPWLKGVRRRSQPGGSTLKDQRHLEALITRAVGNERSHARRLRPRLQALVEHQLFFGHGVDPTTQPQQASAIRHRVFGDTAWLVDPTVTDRAPTIDDLDRFLRLLNDDDDQ